AGTQPAETRRRAQLEELGAAPARDLDRLAERGVDLRRRGRCATIAGRCQAEELGPQTMQLGLDEALAGLLHHGKRLLEGGEPFARTTSSPARIGEECQQGRVSDLRPGAPPGREAGADLLDALRADTLRHPGPAAHDRADPRPLREAVLL